MNSKTISSILHLSKSFLLNKKMVSLFVFVSLSINGFMPSVSEASKYSIVMIGIQATEKLLVSIIERCDLSIGAMAKELYCKMTKEEGMKGFAGTQEEERPTAGDGEGIKQAIYNEKIKVLKEDLSVMYGERKSIFEQEQSAQNSETQRVGTGILLIFLLFIIGVTRRKEIEALNTNIINIGKKSLGLA